MIERYSFGYWVLRRRKALDLTRTELARQVGCATVTIKKIERDERRPSHQIAQLLAKALAVPSEEQALFLQVARGERSVDRLKLESMPLTPFRSRLHNLPAQSTSFIGRQDEIADLKARLADPQVRLCTILGPGGIGKTRLALQVASELIDTYPGGVWLVELAALSNPKLIASEISAALGVYERPNREISEVLVDFLKSRPRLLLVLDNCEHLLKASAHLLSLLLKNCPDLQILATSRQALALAGEAVWPVTGLSLTTILEETQPGEDQELDMESVPEQSEAIRLFVERARLIQPHFHLTTRNYSAVAQICQRLDGMPLAIELAAARMNVLSVEEIEVRLNERFQLLRSKSRDIEERHQTLYAVVAWSYNLLSGSERLLFDRLSVFRGSFTLQAAEAVGAELVEGSTVLDLLSSLVEKSMVVAETGRPIGTRYRLLESLRLFGQECLIESQEQEAIRQRHATYFTRLAEEADPQLRGPGQVAWLEALELDHDNLRTTLEWTERNNTATGLRLASALWWFWINRGYFAEGREWMEKFLATQRASLSDPSDVKAYVRYAYLMSYLVSNPELYQIAEEGLRRAESVEDTQSMAISLLLMAGDPYYASDVQKSGSLLKESLALFRQDENKWGTAMALRELAALSEIRLRDHTEAKQLSLDAMALFSELQDSHGISSILYMLGEIERHLGNWDSANSFYRESLSYKRELNDRYGIAIVLWKMGTVVEHQNQYAQATRLREASLEIFREIHHQEMTAILIGHLAYSAFLAGHTSRALELCQQNLRIATAINNRRSALHSFVTLGEVALSQSDTMTAFEQFCKALALVREYSLPQNHVVSGLEALARLANHQSQIQRAVQLLSAAEALRNMMGLILHPKIRENWENTLNHARAQLDEDAFTAAWDRGHSLVEKGWEYVIAYAMGELGEE